MTYIEDVCDDSKIRKYAKLDGPTLGDDMAPKFNRRQWLTLFAIGSVHFSSAICISLQAPFYPQEAELKGASATQYGLVFGSFEFIAFVSSPFFGKHIDAVGAKLLLNMGMVIAAISAILFGLLDYVMDEDLFISLSFLLRMTESLGSTSALVAAFSITAAVFPDSVATTFATLEVFYGVGYIVGPTVGGILYSIGGYFLPFVVNGSVLLLVAFAVYLCLPHIARNEDVNKKQVSIFTILKVPPVLLNSLSVVATSISMGYYSATLEPHLRQFNLPPFAMGLMFIISGGTYALIAPIVGRICDKWVYPKRVIAVGSILVMTSYIIVGPAPFLPLPTTLPLCIIGLVIHGFGLASLMVPTFIDSICSAVDAGFDDDISTYGLLSGLWSSSFALGAFIGPSVAGFLYDHVGFRNGTLFVIIIHAVLFISVVLFVSCEEKPSRPPKRVRLLSERVDDLPSSEGSSDHEACDDEASKSTYVNIVQHWNQKNGGKVNGYGSIPRSIDYIS